MRNPYEEAFANYPTMRAQKPVAPKAPQHRHYQKPERYNASQDMNDTTRTVVQGAVLIGAMGLFGSMLNK